MADTLSPDDLRQLLKPQDICVDTAALTADADEQLAKECQELLGYDQLQKRQPSKRQRAELHAALFQEGVRPFTSESVKRYKNEMCERNVWLPYRLPGIHQAIAATEFVIRKFMPEWLALVWFIGTFVGLIVGGFGLMTHRHIPELIGLWSIGSAAILAILIHKETSCGSWNDVDIKSYEGDIPTMLLHRAVALKRHLPDAQFLISEYRRDIPRDPFLVIKYGQWTETIGVWDERDFDPKKSG